MAGGKGSRMIFSQAQRPQTAIDFANRVLVGSPMKSSEWNDVPAELRARAFFSSQVEDLRFLQRGRDAITDFLASNRNENGTLKTGSRADFVKQMQDFLGANGVERTTGDLQDIASESRLSLIFNVNTRQAEDYGYWKSGMNTDILNEFPAQRFIRVREVMEPRLSHEQFENQVFLKTDPIWWRVINHDFGVPWGPWGWGCGHDVEDVDRDEAEELGLIEPRQLLTPDPRWDFNIGAQASAKFLDEDLIAKLLQVFGDKIQYDSREKLLFWRLGQDGSSASNQAKSKSVTPERTSSSKASKTRGKQTEVHEVQPPTL